ncbi:MAG: hypothetical protein HYX66_05175 [Ignavibacteria bacterium]|nr:hypothetical protein [Ignavibacteria bacterium]
MIRSIVAALFLVCIAAPGFAQDDRLDDLDFEEAPITDEPVPYFAIGVGPVLTIGFPSWTDLNTRTNDLSLDAINGPLLQWGAEIFTAIGVVPNVRVGFSWVNGSNQTQKTFGSGDTKLAKTLNYRLNSVTFHADYAIVPFKSFAILPGAGLGWGTQTISTFQAYPNRTWNDYKIQTSPDMFSELTRTSFYVMPRLNVEYALTPFVAIRAQAAYTLSLTSEGWTGNRVSNVSGVPSGISVDAFSTQVGILIGLFN